jgi:hydroxymethylpyrimidine/phosphomethylpyrimidine kinase
MQTVLTIAGFDPSSGAGVTADLMVFAAHGLFGTACITGLTVQSTVGVRSTHPVEDEVLWETLECLDADIPPAGIKIGMVASSGNILRICSYIGKINVINSVRSGTGRIPTVLDPILRSSSGRELLDPAGFTILRERLIPRVDWITPNVDELAILSGQEIACRGDLPAVCRALQTQAGVRADGSRLGIFATGGHLETPDDFLLTPAGEEFWLVGERVATDSTHGTGCALSSAFLSRLVLGDTPQAAALAAKAYVVGALRNAVKIGAGNGPMNHLWTLSKGIDE